MAALALIAPLATPGPGLAQTPSTDFRTYAVIAGSQIKLGSGALVLGGNAAATDVDGILMVGKGASCPVLGDAVGDRAKLLNGANVGRLFSNEPILKDGSSIDSGARSRSPCQSPSPTCRRSPPPSRAPKRSWSHRVRPWSWVPASTAPSPSA
jgi:hypothetical protein